MEGKIQRILLVGLITFGLASCELMGDILPEENLAANSEIGLGLYTIESGNHSSGSRISVFSNSKMVFEALFDSSAIYSTTNPSNQADINKLYGFSDCGAHHHTSSARFGWRWYENQMQIFAYAYNHGERITKFVASVPLNEKVIYSIEAKSDEYIFQVGKEQQTLFRDCSGGVQGYRLYPYFGGDEQAPQTINIWLSEVDN
jgi:hypothetical protein